MSVRLLCDCFVTAVRGRLTGLAWVKMRLIGVRLNAYSPHSLELRWKAAMSGRAAFIFFHLASFYDYYSTTCAEGPSYVAWKPSQS